MTEAPPAYAWRSALTVAAIAAGVSAGVLLAAGWLGWDVRTLVRDPVSIAREGDDVGAAYVGGLSHAGVIAWALAATAAAVDARLSWLRGDRRRGAVSLTAALLSAGLLVDDLYLVHESLVPRYTPLGEEFVLAGWALATAAWLTVFAPDLRASRDLPLLGAALALFAGSVAIDVASVISAAEEGFKFAGILCWAAFFWRRTVAAATGPGRSTPAGGRTSGSRSPEPTPGRTRR